MSTLFYVLLLAVFAVTAAGAPAACDGCKCCAQDLITITTSGSGAHPFDSDVTDTSGQCAVRTFTCKGEFANIEINVEGGVVDGGEEVTFAVTCNAAGTAWESEGLPVTRVECASQMIEQLAVYNIFNYFSLFLISIYILTAVFLIVAVQLTQLHPNCKFLLNVWGASYFAQFVCFTAIFMLNATTSAIPRGKRDPPIRSYLLSATTGTQFLSECLEIVIATERIISSIDPASYHLSGRNIQWLITLTIVSASAASIQAWIAQIDLHFVLAINLVVIELCSLTMNFAAVRYCGRRSKELYGTSTLNARYQVKEACELAISMQRAYLVTFLAKNIVNCIVLVGCVTVNENHECVPLLFPLPYVLMQTTYCLGFSTTSAFLLVSLLHNHPRLRLKSAILLSTICGRKSADVMPVTPVDHGFVGDVYFEELKKSWT